MSTKQAPFRPSRFTPSLMAPADLEELFVQREQLAARLVSQITSSVLEAGKQHNLIIGPRGMGKTHLVAIVYHRLRALEAIREKAALCWLREDEWGINSFLELVLRILRVGDSGQPLASDEDMEHLFSLSPAAATKAVAQLLLDRLKGRTLVLLLENLDQIFDSMGPKGQAHLRSFLQENACCTMLATTPAIFGGISLHNSTFYGFFRIQHLDKLCLDEAVQLMAKIAEKGGKTELVEFINTPLGRGRIRAVYHLSGGNPRIHVVFSEFIHSKEDLDELVQAFLRTLDELTPYYQAKMQVLPPQQRQIVEFLCDNWKPAPVKEIAKRCFILQQTCATQLRKLAGNGLVLGETKGRETLYQVSEPLMRHCFSLKKQRGEPVELCVEFLRIWYSRDELENMLERSSLTKLMREHVMKAMFARLAQDPVLESIIMDLKNAQAAGDWKAAAHIAEEAFAVHHCIECAVARGSFWALAKELKKAREMFNDAITQFPDDVSDWKNLAYFTDGLIAFNDRAYLDAIARFNNVSEFSPHFKEAMLFRSRGYLVVQDWKRSQMSFAWLLLESPDSDELKVAHAISAELNGSHKPLTLLIDQCSEPPAAEKIGKAVSVVSGWAGAASSSGQHAILEVLRKINSSLQGKGLLEVYFRGFLFGLVARIKEPESREEALKHIAAWPHQPNAFLQALAVVLMEGGQTDTSQFPIEERAVLEEIMEERRRRGNALRS